MSFGLSASDALPPASTGAYKQVQAAGQPTSKLGGSPPEDGGTSSCVS